MTARCPAQVLFALLLATVVQRAQESASSPDTTLRSQYDQVVEEYGAAQAKFFESYQKATTDDARSKLMTGYPSPEAYAPRMLRLALDHPKDALAEDALIWIVTQCRSGSEYEQAVQTLSKEHLQSAKLGPLCLQLVYSGSPRAEGLLQELREKNPHHEIQGQATYALAKWKSQWRELAEAERLFEGLLDTYADVQFGGRTLGELAKSELFEIRNLAVGKPAPEIVGQDLDGNTFTLSEYRGKVVVLDFWGDW